MATRVYLFFFALLVAIVLSAWLLEPHSREGEVATRAAQVEFDRYHYYEITPQGVDRLLLADKGWHYGTHEELKMPIFIQRGEGFTEGLSGLRAIWRNEELDVIGEVLYWHSEGYNLFTERAVYNDRDETIRGRGPFTFQWSGGQMQGYDFIADGPKAQLQARDVQAVLQLDQID